MSTTTDEAVALTFAKEGDARTASTLVVASMGMVDRGATLDWLSQYPHEREVLLPPLTAMEVVDIEDFVDSGAFQIRKLHVRLNTNMVSMTIENLLSVRKKQVSELVEIVARDMSNHDMAADIGKRTKKLRAAQAKVQHQPSEAFNENQTFLQYAQRKVLDLMPQTGDCIQELYGHSRDVYGLVATESGFASSSWDGTLREWSLGDGATYSSTSDTQLPSASLALVAAGVGRVASSQFNGVVSMVGVATDATAAAVLEQQAAAAPRIAFTVIERTGNALPITTLSALHLVAKLKQEVATASGTQVEHLQLVFKNKLLADESQTLGDYGVEAGSTVNAMSKSADGAKKLMAQAEGRAEGVATTTWPID